MAQMDWRSSVNWNDLACDGSVEMVRVSGMTGLERKVIGRSRWIRIRREPKTPLADSRARLCCAGLRIHLSRTSHFIHRHDLTTDTPWPPHPLDPFPTSPMAPYTRFVSIASDNASRRFCDPKATGGSSCSTSRFPGRWKVHGGSD